MKKKLMALLLAFALTGTLAACGDKDDDTTTTTTKSESSSEKAESTEKSSSAEKADSGTKSSKSSTSGKSLADATEEEDMGDYHVKINNAVVTADEDGNQVLVVHFDFTNNSDEAKSAYYGLSDFQAFQDGIELETVYSIYDNPDYNSDNIDTDVQPGYTMADCQIGFILKGTSDVEFQISAYDEDYNNIYAKKTFAVQ